MLEVQKYLQEHKYTCLEQDFGIRVKKHDIFPLYILNYHQIQSPKNHPISNECRGLVLDERYNLVARAFTRFFNWDEVKNGQEKFDWTNYRTFSKEDGTLILLYNWNGRWFINTRGSFGGGQVGDSEYTWEQLVCQALRIKNLQDIDNLLMLDPCYTYIFELTSPYNKIVTPYSSTQLYFLSAFCKYTGEEIDWPICKMWMIGLPVLYPQEYLFTTLDEILQFIKDKSKESKAWEGVVIRDVNNLRYKIKSETYLALHRHIKENTVEEDFAEELHAQLCRSNHTDECEWFYERRWSDHTHKKYLEISRKLLDVLTPKQLEDIILILKDLR